MHNYFKKVFSIFVFSVFALLFAGCSSIKDGPTELGDKVFIKYTATFEKNPEIIYDTTQKEITNKSKKNFIDNTMGYSVLEIGSDDYLPSKLQESLVGMMPGDTKVITLSPSEITDVAYDAANTKISPMFIYDRINVSITKGKIMTEGSGYVSVKAIVGEGQNKKIIFDTNPLETYNNVIYNIELLQIGGSELESK